MPLADVNRTTIFYRFDGEGHGPVVMLSNSLSSDLTMWVHQVPALTAAGYRVLRYDSRGHGSSAAPPAPYSMEMLADDAVSLLDTLGLDKVHFCGLSKGGMVGQVLGANYGDRLHSLVLSSTAAVIAPRELWDERIAAVRKGGMAVFVDATIDRWFTKPGQRRLPNEVKNVRAAILKTPVEGFCACCGAIRDMDLREALCAVNTPTLVMVGKEDQGTPVSAADQIHQRISGSTLNVIPGAAHFVQMEQSAAFNEAMLSFLSAATPSS